MKIVIVGSGKVGNSLIAKLTKEGHDITLIDIDPEVVSSTVETYDVLGIVGNGATFAVQSEADVKSADLFIAVADSDEVNLLCCLIAKKLSDCKTIARVRNPNYFSEISFIREKFNLDLTINPEKESADEIARMLKYPGARQVENLSGNIEVVSIEIENDSILNGLKLSDLPTISGDILIGVIERNEEIIIPNGSFVLEEGDYISFAASKENALAFFKKVCKETTQDKNIIITGGGDIALYLSKILVQNNLNVTIVEKVKERCLELSNLIPGATIINGNGNNRKLLQEIGIEGKSTFIALTSKDEENIVTSLYAKSLGKKKVITKVSRSNVDDEVLKSIDLDTIISPKEITSNMIIKYVRSMENSMESNIEALYLLHNGKVEAIQFKVSESSNYINIPLMDLKFKDNVLVGSITRNGSTKIPKGGDVLLPDDLVFIVTSNKEIKNLDDILE